MPTPLHKTDLEILIEECLIKVNDLTCISIYNRNDNSGEWHENIEFCYFKYELCGPLYDYCVEHGINEAPWPRTADYYTEWLTVRFENRTFDEAWEEKYVRIQSRK